MVTCQYAHQDHSESTPLGVMSAQDVLSCFDEFDWSRQVQEAERLAKVSPTLSVEHQAQNRLIWVSAYSDAGAMTFVSECTFPGMKKRLFGLLGEGPGTIELYTDRFTRIDARRALELFLLGDENSLRDLYKSIDSNS